MLPGTYQVRLTAGGRTYTQPLTVKLDPRSTATAEELSKQFDLSLNCWRALGQAADAMRAAGNRAELTQISNRLRTALIVAQSADRTPPAVAYTLYEGAMRELRSRH